METFQFDLDFACLRLRTTRDHSKSTRYLCRVLDGGSGGMVLLLPTATSASDHCCATSIRIAWCMDLCNKRKHLGKL